MQSEVACNSWIALLETTQPGTDWTVAGVETRLEEKQHRENSQSRQVCMCGYYSPLNSKMCWKHLLACPCQATCNGQFKNLCTAFNEIWYWEVLPKLVYTFQLLLQSDSINSYCTCFSVCLKVFSDVRGLSTVNKLFADINMIVFLIFTQQMWHRFGCNAMYAQIFGENLMTCFFKFRLPLLLHEQWNNDWNESLSILFGHFLHFLMLKIVLNFYYPHLKSSPL